MPKSNTCSQNKTKHTHLLHILFSFTGRKEAETSRNSLLWIVFLVRSKIYTSEILPLPSVRIFFLQNHTDSEFWAILINSIMVTENLLILLPLFSFS